MAVYDGNKLAKEQLFEIAKMVASAALRAPQITGTTKIRTEIVTGEDLEPIIEIMGEIGKFNVFVRWDYETYKAAYEENKNFPLLLIGADASKPAGFDCGACGFKTCREFAKFVKENKGMGGLFIGPNCALRVLDVAIACDWACAAAALYKVDARIQGSSGGAALMLGHLEGCTAVLGLPIGPPHDLVWFSRRTMHRKFDWEEFKKFILQVQPTIFLAFPGGGRPKIKDSDKWWEREVYPLIGVDEDFVKRKQEAMANIIKIIERVASEREKKNKG